MAAPGGRLLLAVLLTVLTAVSGVLLLSQARDPGEGAPSDVAAAASKAPPLEPSPSAATEPPAPAVPPPATGAPIATLEPSPAPSGPLESVSPATGLVPGSVNRSSLALNAIYDVNAALTVFSGVLDVSTTIVVRNDDSRSIDRLELNTVAARLGRLRVTAATVDDRRVKVRIDDQTLFVPLGGVLEPGVTTTVQVSYRATLRTGLTGSDWMFTRADGTYALYRWIPWVSRAVPFDRPNQGDPFVTVSSPEVSIELLTDTPLVLAAPAPEVAEFAAGSGTAWAFTLRDVRDVALVLAPDFELHTDKVGNVTVRSYERSGTFGDSRLIGVTTEALRAEQRLLGVDYPWPLLVAVETQGGEAMESPGQIWIPRTLDSFNRTYLVHHEVAHQWFYGLLGNDQRAEPFLDEATADQLARTVLGSFRATRCSRAPLDGSIARYKGRCYYEVVYVQGGRLLDDVRARIGTNRYWKALAAFVEDHRFEIAKTRQLLDALEAAAPKGVKLRPLFRERFPSLY
jgi:hypothetical protein